MVEFDLVPFHRIIAEIAPNTERHYHEMTDGDDYGPPDIDWNLYYQAGKANQCIAVTVRDGGKLVGYAVFTIGRNPRYRKLLEAHSDGIFLEREYRGKIGMQLLSKCDEYLQKIGVQEANYTISDELIGKLLQRKGYQSKYKIWSKKYGQ